MSFDDALAVPGGASRCRRGEGALLELPGWFYRVKVAA